MTATRLSDRLAAARRRHFVGRAAERDLFRDALRAPDLPFLVLYIYGPGGIGKSSLLREYLALAQEAGVAACLLDARDVEPSPEGFANALRFSLGLPPGAPLADALAAARRVLLIDTVELLAPLDAWLRETFLPQLPDQPLVVFAGRNPPAPAWRADPGWEAILRVLPLRNLSGAESRAYLAQRGVPADQQQAVLDFTHGHPLALSLVAETFAQREPDAFRPDANPNIIAALVERFIEKAPTPGHRAALEACSQVRALNESLLAAMLKLGDPRDLFEWLRGLSFVEASPLGIYPHDLAREALLADARWRHPDWFGELRSRARRHYLAQLDTPQAAERQRILFDLIYLHRDNPAVRPYFEWTESGTVLPDALRPADEAAILEMVRRHEGAAAGRLAAYWLARQPGGFLVFRGARQQAVGFMAMVAIERATPDDLRADAALETASAFLAASAPLRAGERATLFRFWMAAESYQGVSPVQSLIFIYAVNHYLTTPGLAFTLFPVADPDFWATVFAYVNLQRLPGADFQVDGKRYGAYGNDWRVIPQGAWLASVGEREVGLPASAPAPRKAGQIVVLSQPDFAAAVRDALRDFTRPDRLRANPLTHSRMVAEALRPDGDAANALQTLIRQAAEPLEQSPRDAKLHRALRTTYLQPALTQERAAELLDLPFSTYRRHLTAGVAAVTDALWRREVGA
jgi:hypothetical protein